jgi:hypothetical protein
VADQIATEFMAGVFDDAIVPEVFVRGENAGIIQSLAILDKTLSELFIRLFEDVQNTAFERLLAGQNDMVQDVS